MTPEFALRHTLPAALALLPGAMDSPEARALLLAIGLQESWFAHRVQVKGPARGYWQFEEQGGVKGVLTHPDTKPYAQQVCVELDYTPTASVVYQALADNDVLACVFARLLLWTLPGLLATRGLPERGWRQYVEAWRPGKPHRDTWPGNFARAWTLVEP